MKIRAEEPPFVDENERFDDVDRKSNMGTTQLKQGAVLSDRSSDNFVEDIAPSEEYNIDKSSSNNDEEDLGDSSENDVDDIVDDDDVCNLVVNMESLSDMKKTEAHSTALTPLSVPKMTKSFQSTTLSSSPPQPAADEMSRAAAKGRGQGLQSENAAKLLAPNPGNLEVVPKKVVTSK